MLPTCGATRPLYLDEFGVLGGGTLFGLLLVRTYLGGGLTFR